MRANRVSTINVAIVYDVVSGRRRNPGAAAGWHCIHGTGAALTGRIIIDTDIGEDLDDAYALALALRSRELDVAAVVTTGGQPERRAAIARRLIRLAGRRVPVFAGRDVARAAAGAVHYEFADAGDGARRRQLDRDSAPSNDDPPRRGAAAPPDALLDLLTAAPTTLLSIGGLTNAAWLLDALDAAARRRLELLVMGGSFARDYRGVDAPALEGNIARDTAAARRVLESDVALRLVPLDATWNATLPDGVLQRVHRRGDPLGAALGALHAQWERAYGYRNPVAHDAVALALLLNPGLARWDEFPVRVDASGYTRRAAAGMPRAVAIGLDRAGFMKMLARRLAPSRRPVPAS